MSNVLAALKADCVQFGFTQTYVEYIAKQYTDGLIDYDPETHVVQVTPKGVEQGFSLRPATRN